MTIVASEGSRKVGLLRWGLIPPYEQGKPKPKTLVNLRLETLKSHPAFRLLRGLRGIVPADGFYEWRKEGTKKLPYRIGLKCGGLFGLAAVFWPGTTEAFSVGSTLAILTTEANAILRQIHPRMPVIVPKDNEEAWLNPSVGLERLLGELKGPFLEKELTAYPISTRINSPKAEGPELIKPIGQAQGIPIKRSSMLIE